MMPSRHTEETAQASEHRRPVNPGELLANMAGARTAWHRACIACGSRNPRGLRLAFVPDETGAVTGVFAGDRDCEGYDCRMHGGVIATLLDAAMTNCLFAHGVAGVTAELTTRCRQPVEASSPVHVRARRDRSSHGLYFLRAELVQGGTVKATAAATFMERARLPEQGSDGASP